MAQGFWKTEGHSGHIANCFGAEPILGLGQLLGVGSLGSSRYPNCFIFQFKVDL